MSVSLHPLVEHRYVRKANQGFVERARRQVPEKSQRAVAAARAEHSPDVRIAQGGVELGEPPGIRAGQVSMPLEDSRIVLNAVTPGQMGESRLE